MPRLLEIEARKKAIRELLEGTAECDLTALETELRTLDEEKSKIEKRAVIASGINAGNTEARQIEDLNLLPVIDPKAADKEVREKRGKDLKEMRAVTVGTSVIVVPKYFGADIKPTFNEVSSLIDRVNTMELLGGESFDQPYLVGYGEGSETDEGTDYATADAVFGKATIAKSKVTAYSEEAEEVLKLPNANYDGIVMNSMSIATRKRLTKQILVGNGATNKFAGIFSTAAAAINIATDKTIIEIDETTLDEIIYSFGGNEDVEDAAVLILNKLDLKAFATLRDADGERIYEVVSKGNVGTIDGIPFLINSACKAINDPASVTGDYAMAYGPLSNYTMVVFSNLDVQRSTDYKFKQGMIAHKASIFAGGNVTAKNGFLRVKKG